MSLLKSRKFWLSVISLGVVVANNLLDLELTAEQLGVAVLPFIAAIVGVAWEDAAEKSAKGRVGGDGVELPKE